MSIKLGKPPQDGFGVEGAAVAGEDFCRFPFLAGSYKLLNDA
jgi:hypothetical protein